MKNSLAFLSLLVAVVSLGMTSGAYADSTDFWGGTANAYQSQEQEGEQDQAQEAEEH